MSRSGYTGEDGFEKTAPAVEGGRARARRKTARRRPSVMWIGLAARDSLRLEAGLCLHGQDIDTTTTPVEGALEWSVQKSRRTGGARAGGFPGADKILAQFENGAARRRVGLRPEGRAPVREGAPLFADAAISEPIGTVTSGGFGPSLNAPVAMGYLPTSLAADGTQVFAEVRGQRLPLQVAPCPSFPTPTNARSARGCSMTTLFTSDHEWLRIEGDVATIGVTDYAQSQLGDVVFVELPKVGRSPEEGRSRRRGRIGEGRLRRLRADHRRGGRGQRGARRRTRAGQFRRRRQGLVLQAEDRGQERTRRPDG